MNDEPERIWKVAVVSRVRYYLGDCLQGLKNTKGNLSHFYLLRSKHAALKITKYKVVVTFFFLLIN